MTRMQNPAFPAGITQDDIDRSAELVYGDPTESAASEAPYWPPPSYVPMKRHPEGFAPSRVPMHGEGPTGWWSGLGHELTCDRCGQSWAKRYAADARLAASGHECPSPDGSGS